MEMTVRQAAPDDLDLLMQWRMEVLHTVFSISADADTGLLERANREYYKTALEDGSHVACFTLLGDEIIGCGGICFYREMPSPDNATGLCGYLMNIYTRPAFQHYGAGQKTVRWLVQQAVGRHTGKIYLETSEMGRPLYRGLGFTEMPDQMILPDKGGPGGK